MPSAVGNLSAQKEIEIIFDCPYKRTFHSDRGWDIKLVHICILLKKTKYFKVCPEKIIVMIILSWENFFGILK